MKIYKVEAIRLDRNDHIAYCTGLEGDIRRYYQDKPGYSLNVEEIKIVNITSEMTNEKEKLLQEKEQIENRLKEIQAKL